MNTRTHRVVAGIPTYLVYIILAALVLYPLVWMFLTSLKTQVEIYQNPMGLPQDPTLDNYTRAFVQGDFGRNLLNSMIVTIPAVTLIVVFSAMASYAFARLRFRGRIWLFYLLLVGVIVPPQAILIAVFQVVFRIGLIDTHLGLILVYLSWCPVAILILTTFFRGLPNEIYEAAEIDGAGVLRTLFRVALPLAKPAVAVVAVFYFVWIFNDLIYPLIILQDADKGTIPVGLLRFQGTYRTDWGVQNAALTMAVAIPVAVYMLFQDKFVRGLTAGALK